MKGELSEFINGVGALCETCVMMFRNFIREGLSEQQALWLTGEYLKAMVSESCKTNKEDQNE